MEELQTRWDIADKIADPTAPSHWHLAWRSAAKAANTLVSNLVCSITATASIKQSQLQRALSLAVIIISGLLLGWTWHTQLQISAPGAPTSICHGIF